MMAFIFSSTNTPLIARCRTALLYLVGIALLILWGSCHEDDSPMPEQAQVKVKLKNSGDQYDALYLEIQQIWTRTSAGGGKIDANKRLNILAVQRDSVIASGHVPHGTIQEVMLEVAPTGNQIVRDGSSHPIEMPQGPYIAINIAGDKLLLPNDTHALVLDIQLSNFIERTANGKYVMNPTLTAVLD
ncbi:DUF4382 domain-containing protein [Sphingobacterium sp. N143]|uniref:DUF4382 domain-containing protein n=1 Tax=Sphingobacterium sp. N143 TaxID=2746727 RepID=UPI0025751D55|nr:DUF4382 domain-containing protein [Sphingobacterium sp. N143]MDM1293367.1 DUF4382 domain-containing protein [Sphingobacterium sp. N143]